MKRFERSNGLDNALYKNYLYLFTRHGLKINQEKTEALHLGHLMEELDIALERKKLTMGNSFVYLGGAVCGDGKTEKERERSTSKSTGRSERMESS